MSNQRHMGDAPTAAALREAVSIIADAARFAAKGRSYAPELGRPALVGLVADTITLALAGAGTETGITLAETVLGPALCACIGADFMPEHLASGSLGSEGREAVREWAAAGLLPPVKRFYRLHRQATVDHAGPEGLAISEAADDALLPLAEITRRERERERMAREASRNASQGPSEGRRRRRSDVTASGGEIVPIHRRRRRRDDEGGEQ